MHCIYSQLFVLYSYFSNYAVLKEHFRKKHFLCEEPECAQAQFTHAFRTEIDLKKHIAQEHGQTLTKAQARQARTIELEFPLAPRVRARGYIPFLFLCKKINFFLQIFRNLIQVKLNIAIFQHI